MAKKTFALKLNGVEVKTLEDLRENFDLEKIVEYFKSGVLVEWLADRFYEDEAEALENISADDKNLTQKICAALDAECEDDLEFSRRICEKKNFLAEKTDDENIINNASITALNQDDLANLLHMDYKTIYLCGESFTVPVRMTGRKYIGILSTPKIKIKANSDEELAAKNIVFKNCQLPFGKVQLNIEDLKTLTKDFLGNDNYAALSKENKAVFTKLICQGKYAENQIVYLKLLDDFTAGIALTTDAFCSFGIIGNYIVKYKDITKVELIYDEYPTVNEYFENVFPEFVNGIRIYTADNEISFFGKTPCDDESTDFEQAVEELFNFEGMKKFIDIVKNF